MLNPIHFGAIRHPVDHQTQARAADTNALPDQDQHRAADDLRWQIQRTGEESPVMIAEGFGGDRYVVTGEDARALQKAMDEDEALQKILTKHHTISAKSQAKTEPIDRQIQALEERIAKLRDREAKAFAPVAASLKTVFAQRQTVVQGYIDAQRDRVEPVPYRGQYRTNPIQKKASTDTTLPTETEAPASPLRRMLAKVSKRFQ